MNTTPSFPNPNSVASQRIIYTPSSFARASLLHLQETGTLQALYPHTSERLGLRSYLFFLVVKGTGQLTYQGQCYPLQAGDCVFLDCKNPYSHSTKELWSLQWCHFYGPNMQAIYRKYTQRGGKPVFRPQQLDQYRQTLTRLYQIAQSADYVRDMRIQEQLSALLVLLMEDAWDEVAKSDDGAAKTLDVQAVKEYIDGAFQAKITLDDLAARFFINKSYLQGLFKDRYGFTINSYWNHLRITWVKQQLRFSDQTVESLAEQLHIEPAYLTRLFKKIEGVTPSQYRKSWQGTR